jgi:uncharacterized protein YcaQ
MARKARYAPTLISAEEARNFLVSHHGLKQMTLPAGKAGVVALLNERRCIQLDPLDVLGTNADVVAMARIDELKRGDVYRAVFPGHAFEHFAKERCLLPASHFPWYQSRATETPWWRLAERKKRVDAKTLKRVLREVAERGPITPKQLTNHGTVAPMDWSGWKGTTKATSMALEILWTQCKVVVCGRTSNGKLYDIPERALPGLRKPEGDFSRWALLERVESAGFLPRNSGPQWSMLATVRVSPLPDELVAEGILEEVQVEGSPRRYLAPKHFRERPTKTADDRLRILAPLDPLLWDRDLVRTAFQFDYVWEVYKPAHLRKWGWYVYPLLHGGHLVGRLEARLEDGSLVVKNLWEEKKRTLPRDVLYAALERHAENCDARLAKLPPRIKVSS